MVDSNINYRITLNETNVIKGIAICAMLWHHLFLNNPEYGAFSFKLALTCKMCVALFVFLSGYGMTVQYQKRLQENNSSAHIIQHKFINWTIFLLHRFSKFYLNYWVVFLLTVPLGVFIFGRTLADAYGSDTFLLVNLLRDFFCFQGIKSYNITWWINQLFIVLWLFFPFLYWSMKSKIVSIWMLAFLYLNPDSILNLLNFIAPGLTSWLATFALGIFVAVNSKNFSCILNKINKYILLVIAIMATAFFLYVRNHNVVFPLLGHGSDPFIAAFLSLSIVCFCRISNRKMSLQAFLGKHSMNVYLLHTFIFDYFYHDFIYSFNQPLLIFLILCFLSLVLSIVLEQLKKIIGFYNLQQKIVIILNK